MIDHLPTRIRIYELVYSALLFFGVLFFLFMFTFQIEPHGAIPVLIVTLVLGLRCRIEWMKDYEKRSRVKRFKDNLRKMHPDADLSHLN